MKKVTRKELLEMEGNVLYALYNGSTPDTDFAIKYGNNMAKNNDWCYEDFPVTQLDIEATSFFDKEDFLPELPLGADVPISDCEGCRDGLYLPLDTEYLVYSKDDIRKLIAKLKDLL